MDFGLLIQLVRAFAELRKATISLVMSACLSVLVKLLGSHWTKFDDVWYLSFFSKICRENINFVEIWQQ
jgi:hypothetical protein